MGKIVFRTNQGQVQTDFTKEQAEMFERMRQGYIISEDDDDIPEGFGGQEEDESQAKGGDQIATWEATEADEELDQDGLKDLLEDIAGYKRESTLDKYEKLHNNPEILKAIDKRREELNS